MAASSLLLIDVDGLRPDEFSTALQNGELPGFSNLLGGEHLERSLLQLAEEYADPVNRLNNLVGPMCGDILLVSNYAGGYHFAAPMCGMHGGLHPEDSFATMAFGGPGSSEAEWMAARTAIQQAIQTRCQAENGRLPSTADLLTGLMTLI